MDRDVCSEVIFGRSVRTYMCENEDVCGRKERKGEAKLTPNYNRLRFFFVRYRTTTTPSVVAAAFPPQTTAEIRCLRVWNGNDSFSSLFLLVFRKTLQ